MSRGTLTLDERGHAPDPAIDAVMHDVANKMGLDFVKGPINACGTCGHLACVCADIAAHKPDCKYLRAVSGSVAIECDHGFDVCPTCDPCTCHDHD